MTTWSSECALGPGAVVAATLDPLYEELLGDVVPLLDLPGLLRDLLGSVGADLGAEVTEELGAGRVGSTRCCARC